MCSPAKRKHCDKWACPPRGQLGLFSVVMPAWGAKRTHYINCAVPPSGNSVSDKWACPPRGGFVQFMYTRPACLRCTYNCALQPRGTVTRMLHLRLAGPQTDLCSTAPKIVPKNSLRFANNWATLNYFRPRRIKNTAGLIFWIVLIIKDHFLVQ